MADPDFVLDPEEVIEADFLREPVEEVRMIETRIDEEAPSSDEVSRAELALRATVNPLFQVLTPYGLITLSPRSKTRVIVTAADPDVGLYIKGPDGTHENLLPLIRCERRGKEWRSILSECIKIGGGPKSRPFNQKIEGVKWQRILQRFIVYHVQPWLNANADNKDVFCDKVYRREEAAAGRRAFNAAAQAKY